MDKIRPEKPRGEHRREEQRQDEQQGCTAQRQGYQASAKREFLGIAGKAGSEVIVDKLTDQTHRIGRGTQRLEGREPRPAPSSWTAPEKVVHLLS